MNSILPEDYVPLLNEIKSRIRSAQVKATIAANRELIALYWEIGKFLVQKQQQSGWGDAVVAQIAGDLRRDFPNLTGFSRSNLSAMRQFYESYYNDSQIVQQLVGQIPWGHNLLILAKVKHPLQREWYLLQTLEHGWSRAILEHQIESDLYGRQVEAAKTSNFALTLPAPQSDLAQQMLKDTYVFDFLTLQPKAQERDLELALVEKIKDFLLELGTGFAFMGNQFHVEVGGRDFYIDLLFYHHRLRCLIAIDLKVQEFEPEFAGKMNFYLTALNKQVRHADDQPSIGIILCKTKNSMVVEYALQEMQQPIGVAHYVHTNQLPADKQDALPQPADFERMLNLASKPLSNQSDSETKPRSHP